MSIKDSKKFAKTNGWGFVTFGHHPLPYEKTSAERPTLSAYAGFEGNSITNWFTWPSRFWAVGPSMLELCSTPAAAVQLQPPHAPTMTPPSPTIARAHSRLFSKWRTIWLPSGSSVRKRSNKRKRRPPRKNHCRFSPIGTSEERILTFRFSRHKRSLFKMNEMMSTF